MADVVVCGLIHESNAFAADVTPLDAFVRFDGGALGGFGEGSGTEVGGAIASLRSAGAVPVTTTMAWAQSSGPVDDGAAAVLVDDLVDGVAGAVEAGAVAVVVCLHGSMCAVSDPDVDGTTLARVREAVGPGVPVVATLDWHCSITEAMVDAADALVAYRTYPHIDQEARAGRRPTSPCASPAACRPSLPGCTRRCWSPAPTPATRRRPWPPCSRAPPNWPPTTGS
jgi:microcystin degradation protein MlrC